MKVRDLMTSQPATCSMEDSLASAAIKMWEDDCGILPVLRDGRLAGVITDRDIAMALTMRGARPAEVRVADVATEEVYTCAAGDDVPAALQTMGRHQVRRLPVMEGQRLVGILSMNDIVLEARSSRGSQGHPTYGEVMKAMAGVCAHRPVLVTT